MIINLVLIFLLIIFGAIAKAIMDTLQFHYNNSIFKTMDEFFWNPKISWKNKYKNHNKEEGEKFFCSTTVFVFLTDGWHLFQSIFLNCIFLIPIVLINLLHPLSFWWLMIIFLTIRIAFGLFFELFYKEIFQKED